MKILQVITSLHIGGAEKLIVDMVPLYIEQGHQVDVLLFDGAETPFKRQLKEKGVRVYNFSNGGNVYNLLYIFRLIPFLRRYDIVHTHNTACQLFVAIAKKLSNTRVKLVTTEHSSSNRRRSIRWFKPVDRWMYGQYSAIISVSERVTESLLNYIKGLQVVTIENGINLHEFRNAVPYEKKDKNVVQLTMVAAFRREKDQDTLIRAMALLPDYYSLWLVGAGVRKEICVALAEQYNVLKRVIFMGARTDIPRLLKSSDIIVMSSHYEGLSLSSIEGMAVGKPFIASNVNGLREIVGGAGILFEHGNEKQLADLILKVANDRDYYSLISERCMKRSAVYDVSKTVEQYNRLYETLIER